MRARALLLAAALLPLPAYASPRSETEHVVAAGETLNGIANRAGVSSKAIAQVNGLQPPFVLRTGQKLKIPRKGAAKAPASKPATTSPERESVHVVTDGETLGGIANRAKVPRILIAEANGLAPPYAVLVGQKLLIPRTRRYTVRTGDTGLDIASQYGVSWSQIAVANGIDPAAALVTGRELLIPTVLDPTRYRPIEARPEGTSADPESERPRSP